MKLFFSYLIIVILLGFSNPLVAQLNPSSLRCLSVNSTNDITLTWVIPPDPSTVFTSYEIYHSTSQFGPFTLIGTVTNYSQNTYTHLSANGSTQSQYYYIITTSNGGANSSLASDTLHSLFLNLNAPASGINTLSWNATRTPLLPSASSIYTLSREFPTGTWTVIYTGSNLSYKDTVTRCTAYYNYKVTTTDAQGCLSQSNVIGGLVHDGQAPLLPPLDSVSVNAAGLATLGWESSQSSGAVRYVVYKLISGIWIAIDTVNGGGIKSYTYPSSLANSESETFCIAAMDSCKNITILGQSQTSMYLTSSYDLCSRTAKLSWNAYANLPQGISKYKVYCAINGGAFSEIGITNATSFSHSNLNPNDAYCYIIRVINSLGNITASSNKICLIAKAPSGPTYIYINSVSVNSNNQVDVTYSIDNSQLYKGVTIYKSTDGGNTFNQIAYQGYLSTATLLYTDSDVHTTQQNYFYKIQLSDSCGNPSFFSNTSKTILLKVSNDKESIFNNNLTWNDYATWSGTISSYNIYRAMNGVYDNTPIANVPFGQTSYTDNIESFAREQGLFSYYVEAIEDGTTNIYNFSDKARSNNADAYIEGNIFVPNAFTPTGLNTIWLPVAQFVEKSEYNVSVFDRWGTTVFKTTNDTEGWDGKNTKDDIFVYLIEYKNARGEFIQLKGHLLLVR